MPISILNRHHIPPVFWVVAAPLSAEVVEVVNSYAKSLRPFVAWPKTFRAHRASNTVSLHPGIKHSLTATWNTGFTWVLVGKSSTNGGYLVLMPCLIAKAMVVLLPWLWAGCGYWTMKLLGLPSPFTSIKIPNHAAWLRHNLTRKSNSNKQ